MEIIFYHPTFNAAWWVNALEKALPHARVREWKVGDNNPADYALVWQPPVEMLAGRRLKAVFALGAGVDAILSKLNAHPEMLDASIPLFRLEDTGMGLQMQEYAVSQVLHWFRRFD
ncbi:bifunctional glyoxylate/hydroxypyruvate reductase A, partial [Salmonella enterica subsp. enterica serovar Senftenberg]|nr:bifunctional glyoxylate/hydroxypyruvate reductase A [Salmonella enterica subsp. enterica serovar Senftenberg]